MLQHEIYSPLPSSNSQRNSQHCTKMHREVHKGVHNVFKLLKT